MYGLHYREELPAPVASEFESLVAAIRAFLYREHNEDGTHKITTQPDTVPVGGILLWAGLDPPSRYLLCAGQVVSRVTYKSLFDVIGTTYGAGDGTTTFHLPNFQQRFPYGNTPTAKAVGQVGGSAQHTHPVDVDVDVAVAVTVSPITIAPTTTPGRETLFDDDGDLCAVQDHTHVASTPTATATTTTTASASTAAQDHLPPYLTINFIICTGV